MALVITAFFTTRLRPNRIAFCLRVTVCVALLHVLLPLSSARDLNTSVAISVFFYFRPRPFVVRFYDSRAHHVRSNENRKKRQNGGGASGKRKSERRETRLAHGH